jgi:hypothetical protein
MLESKGLVLQDGACRIPQSNQPLKLLYEITGG